MPGQYTEFRNDPDLQRWEEPYERQQEILKRISELSELDDAEIAERFKHIKNRKEYLKSIESKVNFQHEALEKSLAGRLEKSGTESLKLSSGGSFFLQDGIYPQVTNESQFMDWVANNGYVKDLKIHPKKLQGIVGDLLRNGLPLPNGVKVYTTLKIGTRNVINKG